MNEVMNGKAFNCIFVLSLFNSNFRRGRWVSVKFLKYYKKSTVSVTTRFFFVFFLSFITWKGWWLLCLWNTYSYFLLFHDSVENLKKNEKSFLHPLKKQKTCLKNSVRTKHIFISFRVLKKCASFSTKSFSGFGGARFSVVMCHWCNVVAYGRV